MLPLVLAIAPGIVICLLLYFRQQPPRAPAGQLILAFLLGCASTLPALFLQSLAADVRDNRYHHSLPAYIWYAWIVVAFSEEGSKFLVLRLYAWPKKAFAGPFGGILYTVMIGMGFATVESIEYVLQFGIDSGIFRFFLAVPAHASFAILMGYQAGLAKAETLRSPANPAGTLVSPAGSGASGPIFLLTRGLLIAIFFHGCFDFFVFLQNSRIARTYFSAGLLSFGAFATFYISVRLAMRAIRMQEWEEHPDENSGTGNQGI